MVSVLLSASVVRCFVSRMRDFFFILRSSNVKQRIKMGRKYFKCLVVYRNCLFELLENIYWWRFWFFFYFYFSFCHTSHVMCHFIFFHFYKVVKLVGPTGPIFLQLCSHFFKNVGIPFYLLWHGLAWTKIPMVFQTIRNLCQQCRLSRRRRQATKTYVLASKNLCFS